MIPLTFIIPAIYELYTFFPHDDAISQSPGRMIQLSYSCYVII